MTIRGSVNPAASTVRLTDCVGESGLIRQAFARFPSGVVVVAAEAESEKHALVASSFMVGVSLQPSLVALAVQKSSESWPLIRASGTLGVSVFGRSQAGLTVQLSSKNRAARFDEVAVEVEDGGAVFVEDAALWMECSVYAEVEAGDHWMILLEAKRVGFSDEEPLVWHGTDFRELVAKA